MWFSSECKKPCKTVQLTFSNCKVNSLYPSTYKSINFSNDNNNNYYIECSHIGLVLNVTNDEKSHDHASFKMSLISEQCLFYRYSVHLYKLIVNTTSLVSLNIVNNHSLKYKWTQSII